MNKNRLLELDVFSKLNDEQKFIEISNRLNILCNDNCMPCLIDAGGMLDEAARLHDRYKLLIEAFLEHDCDNYLAFIFYRAPQIRELNFYDNILYQKVGPLNSNEAKLLLKLLFKRSCINTKTEVIDEIVGYIDGYPPCAYYTVWYSQLYGIDNILNDKSYLEDFKARRFIRYVKNLNLTDKQWFLLQYLANEEFVPISLLTLILDIKLEDTSSTLCSLIDNNLVRVLDNNYGIYTPIKSAVMRINGMLGAKVYNEIKEKLIGAFWTENNSGLTLEIIDATLHAMARSGSMDFDPCNSAVRISTIHALALEYYHNRQWKEVLEYSKRALSMDSTRQDIRAILFKSLVQSERWEEAEKELIIIEESGNWSFPYLKGFMLKKRKKYAEAIKFFEISLNSGNHAYSVYRDYGECLHRCGKNKEALRVVKKVLKSDSENIYVLDLILRICIDGQMYDLVEKYLAILEKYDFDKKFLYHRRSSYFAAKEMYNAALTQADAACKTQFASFEAHALKADIYMKLKQCDKAEEVLSEIKEKFGNTKKDMMLGLNCKLLLCTNDWQQAKRVWDNIDDKTSMVNQQILQEILLTKSKDMNLSLLERTSAGKEAELLEDYLKKSPISNFMFDECILPD
jgi:Tfp pilus assembly protein PilF